jgi:hypothetical protein
VGAIELTPDQQARMTDALAASLGRDSGTAPERIETHISWVLIHGGHAYKIKKAVRNPFLDQSTLALRRHACAEELRLNRRLAPDLYLDVVTITGTPDRPGFGGDGPTLDVAVRMRAFEQSGLWDRLAKRGALGPAQVDELVGLVGRFHDAAAVADPAGRFGTPLQVRTPLLDSLRDLDAHWPDADGRAALRRLRGWEAAAFARLAPVVARRLAQGRVRECHGDLHLGNVALVDGRCTVFDGIEFNDDFRWIDVASEIAFMAMDLHAHGLPELAHRFVDGMLQHSGDYDGVHLLDYYLVHRALVRAKVALLRAAQGGASAGSEVHSARHYLDLALQFSRQRRPALLITHGLSGSGKTTLTQGLVEAAGAIRIRADVERKRLAGLGMLERSGSPLNGGLYGEAMTAATYARLLELAAPVLEGGRHAILDATFLRRGQRVAALRSAAARGVPFVILDFASDPDTLRARLRRRAAQGADASEADAAVLDAQLRSAEPLHADELGAVFVVRAVSPRGGAATPPHADWSDLLRRLAAVAPAGAGNG